MKRLALILLCLIIPSLLFAGGMQTKHLAVIAALNAGGTPGEACTVGNESRDGTANRSVNDIGFGDYFTVGGTNCTVTELTFFIQSLSSGEGNVAIYSSDRNTKHAEGNLVTLINTSNNTIPLDSAFEMQASTTYLLVFGIKTVDGSAGFGMLDGQGGEDYIIDETFDVEDTMPNSFNVDDTQFNDVLFIFAESD